MSVSIPRSTTKSFGQEIAWWEVTEDDPVIRAGRIVNVGDTQDETGTFGQVAARNRQIRSRRAALIYPVVVAGGLCGTAEVYRKGARRGPFGPVRFPLLCDTMG